MLTNALNILLLKNADISLAPLTISSERKKVVDFTVPFCEEPTVVLLKNTHSDAYLFSLFRPLRWTVWLVAGLHIVGVAACIFLLGLLRERAVSTASGPVSSFWSCVWYSLGDWLQQGQAQWWQLVCIHNTTLLNLYFKCDVNIYFKIEMVY